MKQLQTDAIILARTDYGEADRILTLLTPRDGKLSLLAKGVRRVKSKLAGGIELFSVSQISYLPGRGSVGRLISSRLLQHYGHIVGDINRTMLGYELIKRLHKATEDNPEEDYFRLLQQAFAALDDASISPELIRLWFDAQLLRLGGHSPNLQTDTAGLKLNVDFHYGFDYDKMAFHERPDGQYGADHIKFLRLLFAASTPQLLSKVTSTESLLPKIDPLVALLVQQ